MLRTVALNSRIFLVLRGLWVSLKRRSNNVTPAETALLKKQQVFRPLSNRPANEPGLKEPLWPKEKLKETIHGSAGGGEGKISGERRLCLSVMKTWRRGMESGKCQ